MGDEADGLPERMGDEADGLPEGMGDEASDGRGFRRRGRDQVQRSLRGATALETAILKFIANPATSGIKPMQSSLASQAKSIF